MRNNGNLKMTKGKNVLTTGDVARSCNVAPRTVSKWFDSGQLKGYRIPGSKDRRIPANELRRFMKAHNMPAPSLASGSLRILVADSNVEAAKGLADGLRNRADYEVQVASSEFDSGVKAQKFSPHVIFVSLLSDGIDAARICRSIRGSEDLQATKVIALANKLSEAEAGALLQKGFDGYISDATDIGAVVRKIEDETAIVY